MPGPLAFGQTNAAPGGSADAPRIGPVASGGFTEHVVRPRETVWSIARRYEVSIDSIVRANAIADVRLLEIGMVLRVPTGAAGSTEAARRATPAMEQEAPETSAAARTAAGPPPSTPHEPAAALALVTRAEHQLREARFEAALETAATARDRSGPAGRLSGRALARLEVVSATAQVALGRTDKALASLERALKADPDLALDPREISPKVIDVYRVARRRVGLPPTAKPEG